MATYRINKNRESKTIVNNTILENGFLLIEELWQAWNGYWVNDFKRIYTYDGNNNLIEMLEQVWNGTNWVNWNKYTYNYDGNNNRIETLVQRAYFSK